MRVMTKMMSTMARVMREWWKVDFISGLIKIKMAPRLPRTPTTPTKGINTWASSINFITSFTEYSLILYLVPLCLLSNVLTQNTHT